MALRMVTGRTPVRMKIAGDHRVEGVDAQRRAGHRSDRRIIPRREPAARLPVDGPVASKRRRCGGGLTPRQALRNIMETFPLFAAVVLAAHVSGTHGAFTVWGAYLYFWARVVCVFLYAAGIPLIRSLVWNVATFGIFLFVAALLSR